VWEGPLGTVAVVGVATKNAEMRAQGYIALLGRDDQSWGWNLVDNVLLHNGDSQENYPLISNAPRYQVSHPFSFCSLQWIYIMRMRKRSINFFVYSIFHIL